MPLNGKFPVPVQKASLGATGIGRGRNNQGGFPYLRVPRVPGAAGVVLSVVLAPGGGCPPTPITMYNARLQGTSRMGKISFVAWRVHFHGELPTTNAFRFVHYPPGEIKYHVSLLGCNMPKSGYPPPHVQFKTLGCRSHACSRKYLNGRLLASNVVAHDEDSTS